MKITNILIILTIILSFSACGRDKAPAPKLFEEQRNALDKAKEIEGKVLQQSQEMKQNTDKQTQ